MKKLSIGSWAYLFNQDQPTNDFHSLVHKLQHLGFQGVELFGYAPHPHPEGHDTPEKRQKLRKMVVDHCLDFSAYVPILWSEKLWSVEDARPFLSLFEKHLIFADDLGIKTIRVDTVEPLANASAFEPALIFDRCAKAFAACARLAASRNINVAWEFEPCFVINKPAEIVALVDAVRALGNANFGVLFDTCGAHMCAKDALPGGALELLRMLKGKITHLHLADSDGTLHPHSGGSRNVPLGTGILPFAQLIPELLNAGVPDDWWCIDLCFWSDAWSVTSDCKRFLDKLRHKYAA